MASLLTISPQIAAQDLWRLNLFAGRHLGESDFDLEQRWCEARLAPLLAGRNVGVVAGLEVRLPTSAPGAAAPDLIVAPGVAITADGLVVTLSEELRPRYSDIRLAPQDDKEGIALVADALTEGDVSAPDGLYVLVLERQAERVDPSNTDPEIRDQVDYLRDARLEWVTRLVAHPLPIDAQAPLPSLQDDPARIANAVCALYLPQAINAVETRGIALVLVAVSAGGVLWADPAAVRREAIASGPRWSLFALMQRAISVLPPLPAQPSDYGAFFAAKWKLDYLPAAGTLPRSWLLEPASEDPRCPFFPNQIGLELVAIPASIGPSIITREMARGPLALSVQGGDRVRLLVAVPDASWRADLMARPQASDEAIDRLHRSYVKARLSWWYWRQQRLALYAAPGATFAAGNTIAFDDDKRITLSTEELKRIAAVSASDAAELPQSSDDFVAKVMEREQQELNNDRKTNPNATLPEPYYGFQQLTSLVHFARWSQQAAPALTPDESTALGASAPAASIGSVVRRAFLGKFLSALSSDLQEAQQRIQLLRDHAIEHRQQFDAHTVNLASLAGGMAGDGLGLSIARWLPYVNLGATALGATDAAAPAGTKAAVAATANAKSLVHPTVQPVMAQAPASAGFVNSARDEAFGVMRNIRPDVYLMEHAHQAYRELYTRLDKVATRVEMQQWDPIKDTLDDEVSVASSAVTWQTAFAASLASRTAGGAGRLERSTFKRLGPDIPLKDAFGAAIGSIAVSAKPKSPTPSGPAGAPGTASPKQTVPEAPPAATLTRAGTVVMPAVTAAAMSATSPVQPIISLEPTVAPATAAAHAVTAATPGITPAAQPMVAAATPAIAATAAAGAAATPAIAATPAAVAATPAIAATGAAVAATPAFAAVAAAAATPAAGAAKPPAATSATPAAAAATSAAVAAAAAAKPPAAAAATPAAPSPPPPGAVSAIRIGKQDTYRWAVAIGQRQARLVGHVEALLRKWEAVVSGLSAKIDEVTAAMAVLDLQIAKNQSVLIGLDAKRREAADDYRMARVLADEDWQKTELIDEERTRLLSSPMGLYYTRIRQTVTAVSLSDPLALIHHVQGEIVPGVADEGNPIVPSALDPFLEALWEVPMGDWRRLRDLASFLPELSRLTYLAQIRYARIEGRSGVSWTAPYQRLAQVLLQSYTTLHTVLSGRYTVSNSLADSQRRALDFLSIADLSHGPGGHLRDTAQLLQRQLEQAVGYLLIELRRVGAAQRFDWAQLAEDDQLVVNQPVTWPGFDEAAGTTEAAMHLRTLVELVDFLYGQLSSNPGAGGTNALRNVIRALIIHSAHGDVSEIAHGNVIVLPPRLGIGAALRVSLDRQVPIGSQLFLMSSDGAIAGTLRVDDHDQYGTSARLVELRTSQMITTGYTVASRRD